MPDSVVKSSGVWAPVRHARHPRVWAFLLAAIDEDVARYHLDFSYLYHYKRYAEEYLDDDDPHASWGQYSVSDSLPVAIIRLEMLSLGVGPIYELPVEPAPHEVIPSVV